MWTILTGISAGKYYNQCRRIFLYTNKLVYNGRLIALGTRIEDKDIPLTEIPSRAYASTVLQVSGDNSKKPVFLFIFKQINNKITNYILFCLKINYSLYLFYQRNTQ